MEPAVGVLLNDLRTGAAIFGDETVWRIDGDNGYTWLMRSLDTVVYAIRPTRSGAVAREMLGPEPLHGVLETDRYCGYNGLPIRRQFCYAHLLRDLKDLRELFPDHPEVNAFVAELAPLLSDAMGLASREPRRPQYRRKARRIKERILRVINEPARHAGVQSFQAIFRENPDKLYHWVEDPIVRPDNNTAERSLRPTVIARKLSFGSQSLRGTHTREVLMSVLGTLQLRTPDPVAVLRQALDVIAAQPLRAAQIASILFEEPAVLAG
jgi:transposase